MPQIKIVITGEDGISYFVDNVGIQTMPRIGESLTVGPLLSLDEALSLEIASIAHPVSFDGTPSSHPVITLSTHWSNYQVFDAAALRWEKSGIEGSSYYGDFDEDENEPLDEDFRDDSIG